MLLSLRPCRSVPLAPIAVVAGLGVVWRGHSTALRPGIGIIMLVNAVALLRTIVTRR